MLRPVLASLAAVVALSGCATFTNTDTLVEFDGEEYRQSDLDEDLGTGTQSAQAARAAMNDWLIPKVIDTGVFEAESLAAVDEDQIAARFGRGIEVAGIACPTVMVTADVTLAEIAADRLRDGDDLAIVFAEFNVDPALTVDAGGCIAERDIDPTVRDRADVAALYAVNAEDRVATGSTATVTGEEFGLVVVFVPFAELNATDTEAARTSITTAIVTEALDVWVDPRYGTFDPSSGVVPLDR